MQQSHGLLAIAKLLVLNVRVSMTIAPFTPSRHAVAHMSVQLRRRFNLAAVKRMRRRSVGIVSVESCSVDRNR